MYITLIGKRAETLQRDWEVMFRQLIDREPSLLVLDDLDLLVSAPQNDQDETLNGEAWYYRRLVFHLKIIPYVYLVRPVPIFFKFQNFSFDH